MSLRDELLSPVPGAKPGGVDLRYDPLYDKIKEARREDDDAPQGDWATERKTADWPMVIRLAKEVLATKSKDLQIAAWLAEASLRREGFGPFADSLDLIAGLVAEQWDHLFLGSDDGDTEMRAAPLEWLALKLDVPVRMTALDRSGYGLLQHREARLVPTEVLAAENEDKAASRKTAIANGKLTPEELDTAFGATPKAWFKALVADINATLEAIKKLDTASRQKFGDAAPNYSRLREVVEEVQRVATQQLKHKLEVDPDPVEVTASGDGVALPDDVVLPGSATAAARGPLAAEPTSRDDATSRIVGAARYLRANDPFNPASYLMLRGFRWGELRVNGGAPDPKLLAAPATNVRTNLKGLLLDSRWADLLEACEGVMGTPQGRGWVDLQRYALTACDALGSDYFAVATAIRGALKSLLADVPHLLEMTLMDDTPTANAETRAWLRAILPADAEGASSGDSSGGLGDEPEHRSRDPFALASAEVRAGRADRAIALLMRESSREKTSRGRFMMQAQLARIMVDAGHEHVAMPILEQLITDIESHKLEEWEAGELVAAPMALLYRVLEKTDGDSSTRQSLYLRICRLDPIQAISFAQP
jgi:type VI secretion system protein ImpA